MPEPARAIRDVPLPIEQYALIGDGKTRARRRRWRNRLAVPAAFRCAGVLCGSARNQRPWKLADRAGRCFGHLHPFISRFDLNPGDAISNQKPARSLSSTPCRSVIPIPTLSAVWRAAAAVWKCSCTSNCVSITVYQRRGSRGNRRTTALSPSWPRRRDGARPRAASWRRSRQRRGVFRFSWRNCDIRAQPRALAPAATGAVRC